MSYREFTWQDLRAKLALEILQDTSLFTHVKPIQLSEHLTLTLHENVALACNINTEKARSEMIITPILIEIRKLLHRRVSLFSGVDFHVDAALGLTGVCDYLLSQSTNQVYIDAPAVVVVEAKNENIKAGLPQCIATMYAAHLYNAREHHAVEQILGVVTTGSNWKFLTLAETRVLLDYDEYLIDQPGKILAIILQALQRGPLIATGA